MEKPAAAELFTVWMLEGCGIRRKFGAVGLWRTQFLKSRTPAVVPKQHQQFCCFFWGLKIDAPKFKNVFISLPECLLSHRLFRKKHRGMESGSSMSSSPVDGRDGGDEQRQASAVRLSDLDTCFHIDIFITCFIMF